MIQSNELRIGNYVNTVSLQNIKVTSIFTAGVHCDNFNGYDYKLIKPISLTEKLLLDFGFSKEDYTKGYIGIDCSNTEFVLCEPNEFKNYYTFSFKTGGVLMFKKIKYVHELQNLYFALTGYELQIKSIL